MKMNIFAILGLSLWLGCNASEKDTSDSGNSTPPPTTDSAEKTCADEATQQSCLECLADEDPGGASAYSTALHTNCICAVECEDVCAAACAAPTDQSAMTQECQTCAQTEIQTATSACAVGFQSDCQGSAACTGFASSLLTCPSP